MNILILNEDLEERDYLAQAFRRAGLQVLIYRDQTPLVKQEIDKPFELVVLSPKSRDAIHDIVLDIRRMTQVPLVLLIDDISESEHCFYLDNGVEMVFERPLSLKLLIRYAKLLLRRASGIPTSLIDPVETESIRLDPSNRTVSVYGTQSKRLTQLEFRLLYVLMTNEDQVITTDDLIEKVWGYTGAGNRDLARGLVRRLRKKIEPEGKPHFIHNLPGVGYRFSTKS